jgi:hypothetical protein
MKKVFFYLAAATIMMAVVTTSCEKYDIDQVTDAVTQLEPELDPNIDKWALLGNDEFYLPPINRNSVNP